MNDTTTDTDVIDDIVAAERRATTEQNAEVLAGASQKVIDGIIACDPRYKWHNPDGSVVLTDDDGNDIVVTTAEYLADNEISLGEVFYSTLDAFIGDIKDTGIVPRTDVVDVLLDLRRIFQRYREEQKAIRRSLLEFRLGTVGGDE